MSEIPSDLKYTAEHEWVRSSEDSQTVRVGITDYAQEALGDVVYVSLPEVGAKVAAGSACGEIESTKSVSDLYAPVSGTVTARNDALDSQPELINSDAVRRGMDHRDPRSTLAWTNCSTLPPTARSPGDRSGDARASTPPSTRCPQGRPQTGQTHSLLSIDPPDGPGLR